MTCWSAARRLAAGAALAVTVGVLAACGGSQGGATYGADPKLADPQPEMFPSNQPAQEVGWPAGAAPKAPEGFTVARFADGLVSPRWMYFLPNGDMLVAQASSNPTIPGAIILLRDADRDGVAEQRFNFLPGVRQPTGMAVLVNSLYVATADALLRFPYTDGQTQVSAAGVKLLDLPYRPVDNGHWTRNILFKFDGTKIYIAVGSAGNIGEKGMETEARRASILEINPDGSGERVFASGLRNPVGMAWEPVTGKLWATVNERDGLGENLVPDYMTHVVEGGFYGWPYSYFGSHVDPRQKPQNPELVAKAIKPDYALGAHTASLGLTFYTSDLFPADYRNGAFIAQRGSWNRKQFAGYKVIFVPFKNGEPAGPPKDFLTGFLNDKGAAQGRPVGLTTDRGGALYVADETGGVIWRVISSR